MNCRLVLLTIVLPLKKSICIMRKCISIIILFFYCFVHAYCQPPGEGWILMDKGDLVISDFNIQDWYTRERFSDADSMTVSIYREDSTTFITKQIWYSGSTSNGKREIEEAIAYVPILKRIVIKVEKRGYDTYVQAVDLPDVKTLKKDKEGKYHWDKLKKIFIHRSLTAQQLGEAQVTASRLQMVVKGDTLEYNVANLQLSAGSMLDNLIRNLPGAQLDNNGRITINGEFVSKMLVNGRQFFNGDPLVALKNLPYYTVGKVKVYHDIGTTFESEADSLRKLATAQLTMDVRLKKQYSKMWLANFEVGGGSRTRTDWNSVYFGRFFTMRFTDHSSIGIYGIANNVGQNYSATHDGNWREMNPYSGGMAETQSGGLDFAVEGKKTRIKFQTDLNVMHVKNDIVNQISNQMFLSTGDIFSRDRISQQNKDCRISWNASFSKSMKRFSFTLRPDLNFWKKNGRENTLSASFETDPLETRRTASLDSIWSTPSSKRLEDILISKQQSKGRNRSNDLSTGATFNGSLKLGQSKKILQLNAGIQYKRSTYERLSFTQVGTPNTSYFNNLFSTSPEHSLKESVRASYGLFRIYRKGWSVSSDIAYDYKHKYEYKERGLYKNQDEMPQWMPDMNTGYAWEYNLRNSYLTDLYTDDHTTTLNFNIVLPGLRKQKSVDMKVEVPFHADIHRVVDNRNTREQEVRKRFLYLTPRVEIFAMDYALTGKYEMRSSLPYMNNLLDIYDDTYSLYRTMGNPNLKQSFEHQFDLSWSKGKKARSQWFNATLTHAILRNHITMSRTYNRETGVTTSMSDNINGNWWSSGRVSFGRALDKAKHFNLSTQAFYTYANSVDYSSDARADSPQRFTVHNNRAGGTFGISYNHRNHRVSLDGSVRWNGLTSPEPSFRNMSYTDMYYTLSFATPLLWGIDFDTDLKLNMRRGYHERSMNTTEWVWNAALSTKLGKSGQWVVRAIAFDLLHNLSNVTNTINAQGHMEWWINSVQSYASLHLVYHIKVKPSKKGIGEGAN